MSRKVRASRERMIAFVSTVLAARLWQLMIGGNGLGLGTCTLRFYMNGSYLFSFLSLVVLCGLMVVEGCGPAAGPPKPSPAGQKTVTFPNAAVQFSVPEEYVQRLEPEDTVMIKPTSDAGITLRFNLHALPEAMAVEFLKAQAEEKGQKVTQVGDKSTFSESGTHSEGGHDYDMKFWQVAFGDSLVVMSAEIDKKQKSDPAVKACLQEVPKMIESMQKY